jgi:hypothetical protein
LAPVGVAELGPRAVRRFAWTDGFFLTVVGAPTETRDEWRGRWWTAFLGAASAIEASAKTARSTATIISRVLRINESSSARILQQIASRFFPQRMDLRVLRVYRGS